MEDNNVYVNIKINTDGVKMGTKEVSNAIARTTQEMAKYGKAAQTSCDSAANAFMKQNQAVANAASEVDRLSAKLEEIKSQKVKTSFLTDEEDALKTLETELSKLENQKLTMENSGKQNTAKYQDTLTQIRMITHEIETQKNLLAQLQNDPRSYTTADTSAIEAKLTTAKQKLASATNSASLAYEKFGNAVSKAKEKVKSTAGISLDVNKSFKKGLTTILKYGFGIRSLYIAWRKLRTAMIEGFKTMAKESPEFNRSISGIATQLQTLKNSFAAAFAPLVTAVAPIIESFLKKLNALMQALSQFIAMISGASTFKVAAENQVDYAKSLEKTGGAAKKAKKYLSGLDEIATFTEKDTSGGAGGGASFIEKAVDNDAIDKFKKIKDLANKIKDIFLAGFKNGLGDYASRLNNIKDNIALIKEALTDIFTDPRVVASAQACVKKIIYAFGQVVGALTSIGITIAQNLVGGLAKFLDQNRERIKLKLIDLFDVTGEIAELIGNYAAAFAHIFEAFGGENGQQLTANIIAIFTSAFTDLLLLAEKVGRDVMTFLLQPIIDNQEEFKTALDNTLGFLASITDTIKTAVEDLGDAFNKLYDEHIKPFVDDVTADFSALIKKALDYYNKDIKPTLDLIGIKFSALYRSYIKPTVDKVMSVLGELIDLLRKLWNEYISPYLSKLLDEKLPQLKKDINNTWEVIKDIIKVACDTINLMADGVGGAIKIIIDLLNGDFSGAWQSAKDLVDNICEDMKTIISNMVDFVKDSFKLITDNSLFSGVVDMFKSTPGIKDTSGYNGMPSNIPHLATGAVIPPNAPFLATLGDQKSGTNFEAPEGLLRQVVREESGGNGSYQFTAQINRRVLFDELISEAKIRQSASGRNPFEFA